MCVPLQVRAKFYLIGLLLPPLLFGVSGAGMRAAADETSVPCVDPAQLVHSVVSISWYFKNARREGGRDIVGERATAWFYSSPRLLVTAAHFANELPAHDWQEAHLQQVAKEGEPDLISQVQVRVAARGRIADHPTSADGGSGVGEDLAILELRDPFPNAQVLDIETEPPAKDAVVFVLGYPGGRMHVAKGIVRHLDQPANKFGGLALLEVQGPNRLLFNAGASGAPVFDCRQARVIATLNGLLTGAALPFLPPDQAVIPTPWGSPTNTAVPTAVLSAITRQMQ
jgi:hypothetical protein